MGKDEIKWVECDLCGGYGITGQRTLRGVEDLSTFSMNFYSGFRDPLCICPECIYDVLRGNKPGAWRRVIIW